MAEVLYLPKAIEDLFRIWRYLVTESDSVEIADRMVAEIQSACQLYADEPTVGQLRPDLAQGIRNFHVKKYVVFYIPVGAGIEVIQVIHGARDIPSHFRSPLP